MKRSTVLAIGVTLVTLVALASFVTGTAAATSVGPGKYEDNNPAVVYAPAGAWTQVADPGASGGTFTRSNITNATASLTVTSAASFSLTTIKASGRGIANVLVDGVLVGTFDGYAPSVIYGVVFGPYALPDTNPHTIAVQVSGNKNPSSSGTVVVLDNFIVKAGSSNTPTPTATGVRTPTNTPTPTVTRTPTKTPTPVGTGPMTSRLLVFNPDTSGTATVGLRLVDQNGNTIYTFPNFTLPPNGAVVKTLPGSVPSPFQGSAVVSSDKNVQALVTDANSLQTARDLYAGLGGPGQTADLPLVAYGAPSVTDSIIAVQNTSTTTTAHVTVTLYDQNGNAVASQPASVAPSASYYLKASSLVSSPFTGSAVVTGDQSIAATVQMVGQKDTASFRALGSGDDDSTLYVPVAERVIPGGTFTNWTETYVRNNGVNPTTITAQYYSTAGVAVGAPKVVSAVPPGGLASFLTNGSSFGDLGTAFQGWLRLTSGGEPVAAYSLGVRNSGARLFGMEGVTAAGQGVQFACGDTLRTSTQYSWFNVVNVGAGTAALTIQLYSPGSGAQLVKASYTLGANKELRVATSDPAFGGAGGTYEGLAVVTASGASIVASVYTPYNGSYAGGVTSYTCSRLH